MHPAVKKVIYSLWITLILTFIVVAIVHPRFYEPTNLIRFIQSFQAEVLLVYILFTFLRGLVLMPSTPFVLVGAILFPDNLLMVFIISLAGVMLTAAALYYFSDFLGFSEKLEKKYPKQLNNWHRRLNSPKATLFVIAWSFFPFVPTDLICYVAGIVKMPFKYMMAGVFIGEAILIYFYVFLGSSIFEYLVK
jgi:uncharacterized membrane protein YdjX (TVP38/TMEM64 family)